LEDVYYQRPDELARQYAEQMRRDAGPKAPEMARFHIRDAEAVADGRRAEFWRRVLELIQH
jgi:hypothetical protein